MVTATWQYFSTSSQVFVFTFQDNGSTTAQLNSGFFFYIKKYLKHANITKLGFNWDEMLVVSLL